MKKTCKIVGRDGKGNGRAVKSDAVTKALKCYLDGSNPKARSFALGLCRDSDEADELVQEACYRALRARKQHDSEKSVQSWLLTILRNAFMDSRRRMERRCGVPLDHRPAGSDYALDETLDAGEEPILERLERAEKAAQVRSALARLGRKDRVVLTLCIERRMTYVAAAKALRIPAGTVRSRVFRAQLKFQRLAASFDLE